MSLSTALNNALSGLTATSRAVDVVSSNVANAMTEGYARREITLASQTMGANGNGVLVVSVSRMVNERALADLRQASANTSNSETQANAWLRVEKAIGYPTESGSLMDRINKLESAFISAAPPIPAGRKARSKRSKVSNSCDSSKTAAMCSVSKWRRAGASSGSSTTPRTCHGSRR